MEVKTEVKKEVMRYAQDDCLLFGIPMHLSTFTSKTRAMQSANY